jgi:hypothetical protein
MKQLRKDLEAVSKSLKSLTRKTEQIAKKVDKLEKAKAKATKKAPAKNKARARPTKRPAAKKATAETATGQVVNIIRRSKKGVDVPTLIDVTGFEDKKIRNIVYKAVKQGKIKRTDVGTYVERVMEPDRDL